jgi:hypothetical protein
VVVGVLLLALAASTPASADVPGTTYAAQKIVFTDPLSGKTVWRMTTDGAQHGALHQAAGDQSSESRSFSPDSTRIVYAKSGMSGKSDGVYMMNVASGVEVFLAPAPWYASPIFARDGSNHVYYYHGRLEVRAVDTVTYAVRTVVTLPGTSWQEKLEVNADGSWISAHPVTSGVKRTVIFSPGGQFHPNWTLSGQGREDGAVWHPSDPDWICAWRGTQARIWHVDTLATKAGRCETAHSSWHPNGRWMMSQAYLWDVDTGTDVVPGGGMYPIHMNINPAQAGLGLDALVTADDRNWFRNNAGRPRLHVPTVRDLTAYADDIFPSGRGLVAVHYSSMNSNTAHSHPHWSFDGRYILWTSDTSDLRDGTPPGGTGRGTDLFIVPMNVTTPAPAPAPAPVPILKGSPTSLSFSAVAGGPMPVAQSLQITNAGGGTLVWSVSDNAAWLTTSAAAGTGNATLTVTANSTGLAAGSYGASITLSATGATGSPQSVAVTLTVAATPTLSVSPASLAFSAVQGAAAPVPKSLAISNAAGGAFAWTVSDNAAWLTLSPASGAGNATPAVSVSATGLAVGTYSATITVTAAGTAGSPRQVPVVLTVSAASPTPSPTSPTGAATVTFDDPRPAGTSGSLLGGVFQGINFGTGKWRWEGPFNVSSTNHVYFNSSSGTSRSFSFASGPRVLENLSVFATSNGTLTLRDNLGQRITRYVRTGRMYSVPTGWTRASRTVTVIFTGGWDLGVDDIKYR